VHAVLASADAELAAGSFGAAAACYREVLQRPGAEDWDPIGILRAHAMWGLVLTRVLAGDAATDSEAAMTLLRTIASRHADTQEGAKAAWAIELLEEVARLRARSARQDEMIRSLHVTIEQLKRIDLNRRPAAGAHGSQRHDP
jgi:hypothetical protein